MATEVVVTGGASGLGRVIADALLARGHPVVVVDRDRGALRTTAADLTARHDVPVSAVVADLSSLDGVQAAGQALAARADVGGLVNNAGGWWPGDQYPAASPSAWTSALTLNLVAPMLLTQLLWARLAAAGGAVVNVGSSGGVGEEAYGSPEYGAAKAGLRRFTTSLAARTDVRVTAVVPGWIGLERAQQEWAALPVEEQLRIGPLLPPGRVADTVLGLLADGRPGEVVEMLRADAER